MSELTIIITIIFIFSFVPLILAEISRVKSMPSIEDFLYAIAPYQHSYTFSQYTLPGTLLLP